MNSAEYFQSYNGYFWQWEDGTDVIAIPGERTIAYKDFVIDVIGKLSPQGLPPFGSLLLTIIATNPGGSNSLDVVCSMLEREEGPGYKEYMSEAISFLKLLSEVPPVYKEGKKRIMLLQAIFQDCHYITSAKDAEQLLKDIIFHLPGGAIPAEGNFPHEAFKKDFRTIGLLTRKFSKVNDIIERVASLPVLPGDVVVIEDNKIDEVAEKDFVEMLIENDKTFHVGSLIKRIWTGLNIPVHSVLPSAQPLGGVSDLTNKGDFDKLLISEFANDDLVFLSRLANNEALYLRREVPPVQNNLQRIILIDISLKNWGTPKAIAYATMIAIARHPKTDIACTVFLIGKTYQPVSIENIHTIIEGLQILDGSLHATNGLEAFLDNHPAGTNCEIIFITESSALKLPGMLKIMHGHKLINYWIFTDAAGNLDVYKKQQNSNKHIQHLQLPLKELWNRKRKDNKSAADEAEITFPILFRCPTKKKMILSASDGEIFMITNDKMLFRFYDKSSHVHNKGWELLHSNLASGIFSEIGLLDNGDYVLFIFNPQTKLGVLDNITTGKRVNIQLDDWSNQHDGFVFYDRHFHYFDNNNGWRINIDGLIEQTDTDVNFRFVQRKAGVVKIFEKFSSKLPVFKNINQVFINQTGNLVFNVHELHVQKNGHIMMSNSGFNTKKIMAAASGNSFVFPDDSVVEIHHAGTIILKSSNTRIPYIYISSVINASIGMTADGVFAGNEYYNKGLHTISVQSFYDKFINEFIINIENGLRE